jgi:hypothetical protein
MRTKTIEVEVDLDEIDPREVSEIEKLAESGRVPRDCKWTEANWSLNAVRAMRSELDHLENEFERGQSFNETIARESISNVLAIVKELVEFKI